MPKSYLQKLACRDNFFFKKLGRVPSFLFLGGITFYQWTLSPDHGLLSIYIVGQCKFRPTCSDYMKKMIRQHGIVIGLKEGFKQVRKCYL